VRPGSTSRLLGGGIRRQAVLLGGRRIRGSATVFARLLPDFLCRGRCGGADSGTAPAHHRARATAIMESARNANTNEAGPQPENGDSLALLATREPRQLSSMTWISLLAASGGGLMVQNAVSALRREACRVYRKPPRQYWPREKTAFNSRWPIIKNELSPRTRPPEHSRLPRTGLIRS